FKEFIRICCRNFLEKCNLTNCVVIFSKTTCPYCKMAKNVFNEIGANYKVVELDEHGDGRRMQEALAKITGARTVPRVFINGNCIGGGSDTKQLHQQGKLVIEELATSSGCNLIYNEDMQDMEVNLYCPSLNLYF
uniref:Glutaredoxin-2, mitochondrial n=1 Tax=Gouania willdenowi TaxID=441366 RepID=A0A8C5DYT5_GOUWI